MSWLEEVKKAYFGDARLDERTTSRTNQYSRAFLQGSWSRVYPSESM